MIYYGRVATAYDHHNPKVDPTTSVAIYWAPATLFCPCLHFWFIHLITRTFKGHPTCFGTITNKDDDAIQQTQNAINVLIPRPLPLQQSDPALWKVVLRLQWQPRLIHLLDPPQALGHLWF